MYEQQLTFMEFYSLQFIVFISFWLIAYYGLGKFIPGRKWLVLLGASLSFYAILEPKGLLFLFTTAATTWLAARCLNRLQGACKAERKKHADRREKAAVKTAYRNKQRVVLWGCIVLNFGILALLKYAGGFLTDLSGWSSIVVPIGISFYTFQSIAYLVDVYNVKYASEQNFARYLLFVSWFPQLLEGPINRYDAMKTSLLQDHVWKWDRFYESLLLILFGLFKKYAIAEQLSPLISQMFDQTDAQIPGSVVVLGILMYSAQQYADFSGGIDIVRGVSKLFGAHMAPNFRQPYFAVSLGDFWRRWHISLGAWMRDYVFYPFALLGCMQKLGKWFTGHFSGNVGKHLGRTVPACIANIVVFLIVGIWHGAEEHYLAWGLYNGLIIAASDLLSPLFAAAVSRFPISVSKRASHGLRIVRTFIIVNIGWYFDRIADLNYRRICFRNTVIHFRLSELKSTLYSYNLDYVMKPVGIAAVGVLAVLAVSILRERQIDVKGRFMRLPAFIQTGILTLVLLMILFAFVFTAPSGGFLYAQF